MFFDDFKDHSTAQFNQGLFWEYDMRHFDFDAQAPLVVERVVTRGSTDDFYALFNRYGVPKVMELLKSINTLSQRDLEFVKNVFHIPFSEMKAYRNIKERPSAWPNLNTPIRI